MSRDYQILNLYTRGYAHVDGKFFKEPISLKSKSGKNQHENVLRQFIEEYCYLWYQYIHILKTGNVEERIAINNKLDKIPIKMNQYRQKNQYWEKIEI